MRDLLTVAPLVSRTWRAITLSPELQRALFFEPDATVTEPVENPLLAELFPPFFDGLGADEAPQWAYPSAFKAMPWASAPAAFQRADASWRRMLVTQPLTQTLVVTQKSRGQGGTSERQGVLDDLSGLRMGVLYDLVVPFVDDGASFWLRWHNGLHLTLSQFFGCMANFEPCLGELFGSDGWKQVEIDFREWVYLGRN
jgi:hypothetical protein